MFRDLIILVILDDAKILIMQTLIEEVRWLLMLSLSEMVFGCVHRF